MYPRIMRFCLLLRFYEDLKAHYRVHFGTTESETFELAENCIVGEIRCREDGFPIRYDVHPGLAQLTEDQLKICERIVYSGMCVAIPQILLQRGMGTIHFTHKLPACVSPDFVLEVGQYVYLHDETPGVLTI